MIITSSFQPAWWLPGPHAQTMYAIFTRKIVAPVDRKERIELSDGDFIDLAWACNGLDEDRPLVIFLHGLGGSVKSKYIAGLMTACNASGWRAVLMHFRGASEEPNRLPRAYHSGDTGDLDYFINLLAEREPHTLKAAVGISLGGNVLLKWLGERKSEAKIHAAAAVSVPFQLRMASNHMGRGFSRIYQAYLLRKLRKVFHEKLLAQSDLPFTAEEVNQYRCFWTFDDKITAPLHGFANVHTYYRQASSRPYLHHIAKPTLIIHALDDPFMTPAVIPEAFELSNEVTLELSAKGGHVGFISGSVPGKPEYWLDQRIPEYLKTYLS